MTSDRWPTVALSNVQRMRVLGRVVPNAQMAESIVDAPFDRVWDWFSDLEHSVPAFDGIVRRLHIRRRDGNELKITSWQGPGGMVPTGHWAATTPMRSITVPSGMSFCATTTGAVATRVLAVSIRRIQDNTSAETSPSTMVTRLRMFPTFHSLTEEATQSRLPAFTSTERILQHFR
jgi:hypothetical protein